MELYSPRHYIDLTAKYASQWNDVPAHDAQFLTMNVPPTMIAGQTYQVSIAFRNTGDHKWRGDTGYQLVQINPEPFGSNPRETPIDDSQDEIPIYGGILRGQPKTFTFTVIAPETPGSYSLQWRMNQQGVEFFGEATPATTVSVVGTMEDGP
jgi:hypothetical protein